jgi:DNA-binding NarL/FixJ family response regulator
MRLRRQREGIELMEKQLRILLADDDRSVRSGLRAFLSAMIPCEIVGEAENGQDAVVQVARYRPDAVLLDLHMPTMDGVQATRIIKTNWPQTPIIVLSLYVAERGEALAAGADAFVGKGDPPSTLITTLLTYVAPATPGTHGADEPRHRLESGRTGDLGE